MPRHSRTLPFPLMLAMVIPVAVVAWVWVLMHAMLTVVIAAAGLLAWVITLPVHDDLRCLTRRASLHLVGPTRLRFMTLPPHPALPAARLALDEATVEAEFARLISTF